MQTGRSPDPAGLSRVVVHSLQASERGSPGFGAAGSVAIIRGKGRVFNQLVYKALWRRVHEFATKARAHGPGSAPAAQRW
jgi:hypothetical protein